MLSSAAVLSPWNDPDDEPTLVLHTLATIELSAIALVPEVATLEEMRTMLVELRVPALAVVDDEGNLRGLVSRTDLLGAEELDLTAADVMSGFIFALPLDATLEQAAALMTTECVGQIIVVTKTGELAGVLTSLDVARHVATAAGYL